MGIWDRLGELLGQPQTEADPQRRIREAAAVLLVEIARADHAQDPAEADAVQHALEHHFALDAQEAAELAGLAHRERDTAVSFDEHLRVINSGLSADDKRALMRFLWRVAYADGELHRYEEQLLRRISDLLYLSHADFIKAKLAEAPPQR